MASVVAEPYLQHPKRRLVNSLGEAGKGDFLYAKGKYSRNAQIAEIGGHVSRGSRGGL